LAVATYQMHYDFNLDSEGKRIEDQKVESILPKEVDKIQRFALLGALLAYTITLAIWISNSIKTNQLIEMWVQVEAISFFFLVPYYIL